MKNTTCSAPAVSARSAWTMKEIRLYCERVSPDIATNDKLVFYAQTPDELIPLFVQRFWLKHLLLFENGMTLERLMSSRENCLRYSVKVRRLRGRVRKALRSVELESLACDEAPVTFQLRSPRRVIRTVETVVSEDEDEPIENVYAQTSEEERIWKAWQQKQRRVPLEIGEVA